MIYYHKIYFFFFFLFSTFVALLHFYITCVTLRRNKHTSKSDERRLLYANHIVIIPITILTYLVYSIIVVFYTNLIFLMFLNPKRLLSAIFPYAHLSLFLLTCLSTSLIYYEHLSLLPLA